MKPYTNYNHRIGQPLTGWEILGLVAVTRAECAKGNHLVEVVNPRRVVYGPYGRRRPLGERYCTRCNEVLPEIERREEGAA